MCSVIHINLSESSSAHRPPSQSYVQSLANYVESTFAVTTFLYSATSAQFKPPLLLSWTITVAA